MSTIELAVKRLALVSPADSAAQAAAAIRRVSGFKPRANWPTASVPDAPVRLAVPSWADAQLTPPAHGLRAVLLAALSALAGAGMVFATLGFQARPVLDRDTSTAPGPVATSMKSGTAQRLGAAPAGLHAAPVLGLAPAAPRVTTTAAEEPATAAQAVAVADKRTVLEAIDAWARAWSERDVSRYLGFYSSEFSPDRGVSRSAWENQRRKRLQAPSSISVSIRDLRLEPLTADRMIARFAQDYAADTYRESGTLKMLVLVREAAGWRIAVEALQTVPARAG